MWMEVRFESLKNESFLQTTPVVVRNVERPLMIVTMMMYIILNRMTMMMTMIMMMRIKKDNEDKSNWNE